MELFFKTLYLGQLVDCEICTYESMVFVPRKEGFIKHIGHYRAEHLSKKYNKIITIFRYSGIKIKPMEEMVFEGHILRNLINDLKYYVFWDHIKHALQVKELETNIYFDLDVLDGPPFEIIGHIALENGHETIH